MTPTQKLWLLSAAYVAITFTIIWFLDCATRDQEDE